MTTPATKNVRLSGWGRYPVVDSRVARPENVAELWKILAHASRERPILARGMGRSYADSALPSKDSLVNMLRLNRILEFDSGTGELTCESGVTLDELLRVFVPRGWFMPVTPGTRFVSVGGALAHDVHGKNHHQDGAFSKFVRGITVLVASGEIIPCSRDVNPDLFFATISGLGLTGIILDVTLMLRRIETSFINRLAVKTGSLEETLACFDMYDSDFPYSVAWIDCLATGKRMGRSRISFGDHAEQDTLEDRFKDQPLRVHTDGGVRVPFSAPGFLLNRFSMGTFNRAYYAMQRRKEIRDQVHYAPFFNPLDAIRDWNRLYGKRGFVQYQFVVPEDGGSDAIRSVLTRVAREGSASFLAVLKRMGPADEGFLSFPMTGLTMTMDFAMKPSLPAFLKELDDIVLDHGGRVYLAKDAVLDPAGFRKMYPGFDRWSEVVSRVNPDGIFNSALAMRLNLLSGDAHV